ncbi:hypothetical protein M408DRAFT_30903 [Serendipita vermifera MAFF 305830]|uniref:Uncharacterized protein n=1 Tax=Serendipita vermifera MAFF 305830 TaxID=933852 RepID=A0A0C3A560_SERVB|nr:hypothetical protein M408DRAFT_30903 [Serendipita vermifera MAFF 305830]
MSVEKTSSWYSPGDSRQSVFTVWVIGPKRPRNSCISALERTGNPILFGFPTKGVPDSPESERTVAERIASSARAASLCLPGFEETDESYMIQRFWCSSAKCFQLRHTKRSVLLWFSVAAYAPSS